MAFSIDHFIHQINKYTNNNEKNKYHKEVLYLFSEIKKLHPADIADILENINSSILVYLFFLLPHEQKADVFMEFSSERRHFIFLNSSNIKREELLQYLTIDELVDFFDDLSDEEVDLYIKLLNKKERDSVLSLLEFPETSAAGIMDSNIVVLPGNITVLKTIALLKRLKANKNLYRTIYVVNQYQVILGFILLEDLVLQNEDDNILSFLKPITHVIDANEDQENVALYMMHYRLEIIPVLDREKHFLGVITSEIIARSIEDEASEDIFKMASLSPIEHTYFQTKVSQLILRRSTVLSVLLLLQSISTMIIGKYTILLGGFLITYIGMITSTGGNTSSQVSALAIQGIASGSIKTNNIVRFVKRELFIALFLGFILGMIGMLRIYFFHYQLRESCIVGIALFCIVILSTFLGSTIPFLLQYIKLDPAYSAGPLLATCMDIFGVIIFTVVIFVIGTLFF